jgi:uncharacterized protein (TIGR00730 family)
MTQNQRNICVYCGSSDGNRPEYRAVAMELGQALAQSGVGLVYGGACIGLMGAVADAALAAGGRVVGIMPRRLVEREVAHRGLTKLRVVETMHERKHQMATLADAFIALPGGYGTLDELCEVLGWAQLGIHAKPIVLLNVAGYYDPLLAMLDHAVQDGFLKAQSRQFALQAKTVDATMQAIQEAWGAVR